MNGLITALAWLLIALTFTGSYWVARYLAASEGNAAATVYPVLIATTITVAFVVVFDFVILLTGLAVILLPGYLLFNPGSRPGPPRVSKRLSSWRDRIGGRSHSVFDAVTFRRASTRDDSEGQQSTEHAKTEPAKNDRARER